MCANSGYVSDPPVRRSAVLICVSLSTDVRAARHALSRALRCDRCVSLSLAVSEARRALRCDRRISLSSVVSEARRCLRRTQSLDCRCYWVGPPGFLKRDDICLSSVPLSAPSQAPLPVFPQRGLSTCAASQLATPYNTRGNIVLLPASIYLESRTTLRYPYR